MRISVDQDWYLGSGLALTICTQIVAICMLSCMEYSIVTPVEASIVWKVRR